MSQMNVENIPTATMKDVAAWQRTEKGLAYERRLKRLREGLMVRDPKALAIKEAFNQEILRQKAGPGPTAVHQNTFLTNMSLQYANDEFIGERLMPVVPVEKRSDSYATYDKRDRFNAPDDTIGPDGDAAEVTEGRSSGNYSVTDRALMNHIPVETIENQDPVFDEMLDLTEAVRSGLAIKREIRIATLLTTAANYPTGNKVTLSGSDQWDSSAGGDPIKVIQTATAALFRGPNPTRLVGFTSIEVFNALVRHVSLLDLFKYTRQGLITSQQLAALFGLDDLLVGAARYDTANSGQTASYSRIWGKHFGILRVAVRPSRRSAHFGTTFQLNTDPHAFNWFDPRKGKAGANYVKIGWSDDHKIVASDTGYLISDAIA
jgi:hypothetical protein